jgi:DnaJ-class molecular chaperone
MAEDHYTTLGVGRSASKEEIQSAYRRLARKYHPDMNPDDPAAKEKFQQVQAAFDVLNDPQKRELYDRYGSAYESMGGAGPGRQPWPGGRRSDEGYEFHFEDLFGGGAGAGASGPAGQGGAFADLFKQFSQRGRTGRGRTAATKGSDLEMEITIPFGVAVLGGESQISLPRHNGNRETVQVKIPPGIEPGKKIRLRGQGTPGSAGAPPGDVLLTVRVAPHPLYRRQGNRLDVAVPVTLAEAIQGAKVDLPTPHGTITLTIPPATSSGKKLRVKGHGVRPKSGLAGDLFAEIQIVLPPDLSDEQRQQIATVAGNRPANPRQNLSW